MSGLPQAAHEPPGASEHARLRPLRGTPLRGDGAGAPFTPGFIGAHCVWPCEHR